MINLQHKLLYFQMPQKVKLISTIGFLVGAEVELARLESRVLHLSQRLDSKKLIDQATAILQQELGVTEEVSYRWLQRRSAELKKTIRELAEAIVIQQEVKRGQAESSPAPG